MRRVFSSAAFVVALCAGATAGAQVDDRRDLRQEPATAEGATEKAPEPKQEEDEVGLPPDAPIDSDAERALPDYDGRGEDPTTAGDVLIWIPRVLMSPLYFVSEFVVRRPLGWLVTAVEEEKVVAKVFDFFTFGPDNNIGFAPTGLIDFGFRPSVGIYFFWNDFIAKDNDLRARAATWGPDWLLFNAKDRLTVGEGHELTVRGEFLRRSDFIFHGIGPESGEEEARYQATSIQGGLLYEAELWRSSEFKSHVTVRDVRFEPDEGCCDDRTVAQEVARGRYPLPPGMDSGYTVLSQGVTAELDTRPRRQPRWLPDGSDYVSPNASGLRLQLRGEHASGLSTELRTNPNAPARDHWIKYGGSLGGYVDFAGQQRALGLSLIADFVDPIDEGTAIPFTELVSLGGERPMRGFLEGRLLGRSSAVAQFDYHWPIWVFVDGTFHYAVGNVFGEHLEGFEMKQLRQSFGMGFRANGSRDHVFELLLAFGSETFDQGAGIENVRFVLGTTSGF